MIDKQLVSNGRKLPCGWCFGHAHAVLMCLPQRSSVGHIVFIDCIKDSICSSCSPVPSILWRRAFPLLRSNASQFGGAFIRSTALETPPDNLFDPLLSSQQVFATDHKQRSFVDFVDCNFHATVPACARGTRSIAKTATVIHC